MEIEIRNGKLIYESETEMGFLILSLISGASFDHRGLAIYVDAKTVILDVKYPRETYNKLMEILE